MGGMIRLSIAVLAVVAAFTRLPAGFVEQFYSRGAYLRLQTVLTPLSNQAPFALLDAAIVAAAGGVAVLSVRFVRDVAAGRVVTAFWAASSRLAVAAAAVFLLFHLAWGLNYQRIPLAEKLEYSPVPPDRRAVVALASDATARLNALHPVAHSGPWPSWDEMPGWLGPAFASTQERLAPGRAALPGRPKRSLLTFYFQRAGVDGMTDPLFLETLVNGRLLPFERPFTVAHEWAHLGGYANEAEANFVGWLICMQGPPAAQYSGWLFLYSQALSAVPRQERGAIVRALDAGPRDDLRAIAERLEAVRPAVRSAGRAVYDRYLRANRVEEGVRSYDLSLQLVLRTRFEPGWIPVLRPS